MDRDSRFLANTYKNIHESLDDLIKDVQSDEDDKHFEINEYGAKIWYDENHNIHRDNDKPAIIYSNGTMDWYQHGKQYRPPGNKPSTITNTGMRVYTDSMGRLHREDGPAVITDSGKKYYYHHDQQVLMSVARARAKAFGLKFHKESLDDLIDDVEQDEIKKHFNLDDYIVGSWRMDDGLINVNGSVLINANLNMTKIPWKFGRVKGSFTIDSANLNNLEGTPHTVVGNFNCVGCNLTSLKGGPTIVTGIYNCSYNNLVNLEGAPEAASNKFICAYNPIVNLYGSPKRITDEFNCKMCNLISLEGAPRTVGGDFICYGTKIKNLNGGPRLVQRTFNASSCKLISLDGMPDRIGRDLNISDNPISSLKGFDIKRVGGELFTTRTKITPEEYERYVNENNKV